MSSVLLRRLRDAAAFKPRPSHDELAVVHVRLDALGVSHAIDGSLLGALTEMDEGLVLIEGRAGAGKSSLLCWVADQISEAEHRESGSRCFPLFVPLSGRPEQARTLQDLGRLAVFQAAEQLHAHLSDADRTRLSAVTRASVQSQRIPTTFQARLGSRYSSIGADLGREVVTIASAPPPLDPLGGLRTLGDVAASHGLELVLLFEDTDAWATLGDANEIGDAFFAAVRPLASGSGITTAVAVQDRWLERPSYLDLVDVASRRLRLPAIGPDHASRLLAELLDRRAARTLGASGDGSWTEALFSSDLLAALSQRLAATSPRQALNDVRNMLDGQDPMPDRLEHSHLLEVL